MENPHKSHSCIACAFDEFDKFEFTSKLKNMNHAVQLFHFVQENLHQQNGILNIELCFSKYSKSAVMTFLCYF